jgi:cephalosporin hydroxylase
MTTQEKDMFSNYIDNLVNEIDCNVVKMINLINNKTTDKNTIHSYLPVYEDLMRPFKSTSKNILEIGLMDGGSIQLWRDYFDNATIYGVDIKDSIKPVHYDLKTDPRVKLFLNSNAYDKKFIENLSDVKFDFIIDDGPHTIESMIFCVQNYSKLLTDTGILIIEDVQCITWINPIYNSVPDELKKYCSHIDLRLTKGRYDDIMFIIKK